MVLETARGPGRAGCWCRLPEPGGKARFAYRERAVPSGGAARLGRPAAAGANDGAAWRARRRAPADLADLGVGAGGGSPGRAAGLCTARLLVLLPLEPAAGGATLARDLGRGFDQRADRSARRNACGADARKQG